MVKNGQVKGERARCHARMDENRTDNPRRAAIYTAPPPPDGGSGDLRAPRFFKISNAFVFQSGSPFSLTCAKSALPSGEEALTVLTEEMGVFMEEKPALAGRGPGRRRGGV